MSRTVTTSTKDTRTAVATLAKVPATPTEANVVSAVTASDKVHGALALTVARFIDQSGKSQPQVAAMLAKAGAPRSTGSIANDLRTGRILDRMIQGGHVPTLDDVRAAVALGNASDDEAKTIGAKVPDFAKATGATLAKALPVAKVERSSIRSAKAKAGAAAKTTKENTSGTPVPPKGDPKGSTPALVLAATVGPNDRVALAVQALAKVDTALGIDPSEFDRLTAEVARVGGLLAGLAKVPVTKATITPATVAKATAKA